jgi:hypothetical protein
MLTPEVLSTVKIVREGIRNGEVEELKLAFNKLVDAVSLMMPGALRSAPALKTGTTSNLTWRSEAFTFLARGQALAKAAAETAFTATTHDIAASKQAWYALSIQAGGTLVITKAADQDPGVQVYPIAPDNEVIVGYLRLQTGSGGIFDATTHAVVAGVSNLVAVEYYDAPFLDKLTAIQ